MNVIDNEHSGDVLDPWLCLQRRARLPGPENFAFKFFKSITEQKANNKYHS